MQGNAVVGSNDVSAQAAGFAAGIGLSSHAVELGPERIAAAEEQQVVGETEEHRKARCEYQRLLRPRVKSAGIAGRRHPAEAFRLQR